MEIIDDDEEVEEPKVDKEQEMMEKLQNIDGGDQYDSDENPFDPDNDAQLKGMNTWVLCHYVDKSHFKLNKVIGVGTHGVVWLVERRVGKRSQQRIGEYFFNRMTRNRLEFIEHSLGIAPTVKHSEGLETGTYKDTKGNLVKKLYAMKIMDKRKLYQMRSIEAVKMEVKILSEIIHPFILYL